MDMHLSPVGRADHPSRRVRAALAVLVSVWALGVTPAGAEEGGTPPGVDDPPVGAESVPVLLVPGWGDPASVVSPLARRLASEGWRSSHLRALTFRDPVGSNEANARELEAAIEALRAATGAERVDIVAHSMGGLAVRHFLQDRGGAEVVRRVVFVGTPHRGTVTALLARGDGGKEMVPGSPFLERLNGEDGEVVGVELLAIRSPLDLVVIPRSSAMLPGARNVEVCCPTHHGMLEDDRTFEIVRDFLRGGPGALGERDGTIPARTPADWWDSLLLSGLSR